MTRSKSISELTVLIAGFGSIGRRHFRNLRTMGCRRFVFYRTNRGTLDDKEIAGYPSFSDLDSALESKPDLAVVANPSADHMHVALAAARCGCHLFVEKPLAATLEGCDELSEIVAKGRLTTMIGCQFRFHPLLLRLHEAVSAGRLGHVMGARAEWGEYLPAWHPWEDYRASYSARAEMGGGVVLTLIHPLDYLYWLFGDVEQVQASIRRAPGLETSGEDWADISLQFESGVIGQTHVDYVQRPAVHRLDVCGEEGRAEWDYHAGRLTWRLADGGVEVERVPEDFDRNDMFRAEMTHFVDAVLAGRPTRIPLRDGIAVLDIALQAKRSASAGYSHA